MQTNLVDHNQKSYTENYTTKYPSENRRFDIRDHLHNLTLDGGKSTKREESYHCPVCQAKNFKINLSTGKYSSFSCNCATTEEGKRKIRDTIAPLDRKEKAPRTDKISRYIYRDVKGNPLIRVNIKYEDGNKKPPWQEYWINDQWLTPNKAKKQGIVFTEEEKENYKKQITLYRWEEVKTAISQGHIPFIVEGEGVADCLWEFGIPATTNIMGSGQWRDSYSRLLKETGLKEAVIGPDRDEIGVKHADQIKKSLESVGIKDRWIFAYPKAKTWNNLPKSQGLDLKDYLEDYPNMSKDDLLNLIEANRRQLEFTIQKESVEAENLSDAEIIRQMVSEYLNAEDTAEKIAIKGKLSSRFKIGKDDLNTLIDEARGIKPKTKQPVEVLTAKDLFNGDNIGIKWLIAGLLPKGGVTILGAKSGDGKTTLAYDCAGAVTFNEEFLGEKPTKQGKVLILSSDEPKNFAIDKLANRGFSEDDNLVFVPNWTIDHWETLENAMEEHEPDLIIIDSFNSIHGDDNFDSNSDRAAITLNRLNPLLEEYDSACILIHHLNKNKENKGVNKLRNSTAIAAASSMVWLMDGEGDIKNFSLAKTRGTEPLNLKIKMDAPSGKFNLVEGTVYDDESKSLSERIEALFKEKYPSQRLEFEEIKAEISGKDEGLRKALGRLVKNEILNKGKSTLNKKKSVWYLPSNTLVSKHSPSPPSQTSCPMKAKNTTKTDSQTLDTHWTDIGHVGQDIGHSLDKDIGQSDKTPTKTDSQTLDKDIGQNSGQGERECPQKVSNEEVPVKQGDIITMKALIGDRTYRGIVTRVDDGNKYRSIKYKEEGRENGKESVTYTKSPSLIAVADQWGNIKWQKD